MIDMRRTTLTALALVLGGCAELAPYRASMHDPSIEAAWVELGEEGASIARVVTRSGACPLLLQDGVEVAMAVRAPAARLPQRPTASKPKVSKPSEFPVLTCEATLRKGVRSARVGGRALPVPKARLTRIVVIGDSGCRLKKADKAYQACNNAPEWPLRTVSESAAAYAPDLVIHVGDYHYRENPCPEGNATCAGSPWGYGWDTWKADFFEPAAPLLAAAPWVVVRGNHEQCDRAGQGWWRFLDPRPFVAGRDCNDEKNDFTGDYSAPYRVPLGDGAQLVIFDSASAPNKALKPGPEAQLYRAQVEQANALALGATESVFVLHHPILGFAPRDSKAPADIQAYAGNAALQAIMKEVNGDALFPRNTTLTLAGHVHLFEAIGFTSGHPAQVVAGIGGSSLDAALPAQLWPATRPYPAATIDTYTTLTDFGFLTMERDASRWSMTFRMPSGALRQRCSLDAGKVSCGR